MAYGQSRGDSDAQAWQPERMDTVPGLDLDSPPFDLLDAHSREHLQSAVDMGFYPAGTRLIEAGKPSEHVFVLCKRSEEHTSELQSLMRISYAVFCLKKKNKKKINIDT